MKPRLPGAKCHECPLSRDPYNGPVPGQYPEEHDPDIIFIAEAPGGEEVVAKIPFVGMTGKALRGTIRKHVARSGMSCGFTNIISCRPPGNRTPTPMEVEACRGRLNLELASHPAPRVVAMGATALSEFGIHGRVGKVDGNWFKRTLELESPEGEPFSQEVAVLASYHPAYWLRMKTLRSFRTVMARAFESEVGYLRDPQIEYAIIRDPADLPEIPRGVMVGFDIETTGLHHKRDTITCVMVSWEKGFSYVIPTWDADPFDIAHVTDWIETNFAREDLIFVGHHLKFDQKFMIEWWEMPRPRNYMDTEVMHYTINEEGLDPQGGDLKDSKSKGHKLKRLCEWYLGIRDWTRPTKTWDPRLMSPEELDRFYLYAATDPDQTLQLAQYFMRSGLLDERARKLHDWLIPKADVFTEMEVHGVRYDETQAKKERTRLQKEYKELVIKQREIAAYWIGEMKQVEPGFTTWVDPAKFNPRSYDQLGEIMYNVMKLPRKTNRDKETGEIKQTTDAPSIKANLELFGIRHDNQGILVTSQELVDKIVERNSVARFLMNQLRLRQITKIVGTYIEAYIGNDIEPGKKGHKPSILVDGRLYPTIHVPGTVGGRPSFEVIVNIPRPSTHGGAAKLVRDFFLPDQDDHLMVEVDQSQSELRTIARLAMEPAMIAAFAAGQDIHEVTAADVLKELGLDYYTLPSYDQYEHRNKTGKYLNFGMVYGMEGAGYAKISGLPIAVAEQRVENFKASRARIVAYQEDLWERARTKGEVVTLFGRRRVLTYIPQAGTKEYKDLRNHFYNFEVQSVSNDLCLQAMEEIDREIKRRRLRGRVMMMYYDSVIASVHKEDVREYVHMAEEIMREVPLRYLGDAVPFLPETKVGPRWGSLVKWEKYLERIAA